MTGRKMFLTGYWRSRLPDWIGGAIVATVIGLPVAYYFYARSIRDSDTQLRRLGAQVQQLRAETRNLTSVIQVATRQGIIRPEYNAQGRIVALKKPEPPGDLIVH